MANEIWFRCSGCGEQSYCDSYFDRIPDAEVMCPFCLDRMKLSEARLDADFPRPAGSLHGAKG